MKKGRWPNYTHTHCTEHFIPVTIHAAQDDDTDSGVNIPDPQSMVFGNRQQQAAVARVELELVHCIPMPYKMLNHHRKINSKIRSINVKKIQSNLHWKV